MSTLQVHDLHKKVNGMRPIFIKTPACSIYVLFQVELLFLGNLFQGFCSKPLPLQVANFLLPSRKLGLILSSTALMRSYMLSRRLLVAVFAFRKPSSDCNGITAARTFWPSHAPALPPVPSELTHHLLEKLYAALSPVLLSFPRICLSLRHCRLKWLSPYACASIHALECCSHSTCQLWYVWRRVTRDRSHVWQRIARGSD